MCSVVSMKSISQQEKGFQAVSLNEVLFGCGFTALEHMLECMRDNVILCFPIASPVNVSLGFGDKDYQYIHDYIRFSQHLSNGNITSITPFVQHLN